MGVFVAMLGISPFQLPLFLAPSLPCGAAKTCRVFSALKVSCTIYSFSYCSVDIYSIYLIK